MQEVVCHQDVFVSSNLEDVELCRYEFSLLWPLIIVAAVLFLFRRKTCLLCRVVFFKVA